MAEKTLRDEFAMAALCGYMAGGMTPEGHVPGSAVTPDLFAARAYQYADAMIRARSKEPT
jgi:hypothetical protein